MYNFLIEPDGYDQYCVAAETAPNAIQVQFWQNTLPEPMELETRDVTFFNKFENFREINFLRFHSGLPKLLSNGRHRERTLLPSTSKVLSYGLAQHSLESIVFNKPLLILLISPHVKTTL